VFRPSLFHRHDAPLWRVRWLVLMQLKKRKTPLRCALTWALEFRQTHLMLFELRAVCVARTLRRLP
jgi:hypothetical protein